MGIYDRDYVRSSSAPGAQRQRPGAPVFSVTGWIIGLCCVVFALNVFVPKVPVLVRTELLQGVAPSDIAGIRAADFETSAIVWGIEVQGVYQRDDRSSEGRALVSLGGNRVAIRHFIREPMLTAYGYFSTSKALLAHDPISGWSGLQVWRFITFQFLHANLNHIIFNMLTLYFFGGMVEHYLGRKRYLAFYLLCGVCGALMFLLLNGLALAGQAAFGAKFAMPGLLYTDAAMPLVGASAGVFGVIMAGAYLVPNAQVLLFFIVPMRLRTLAYGLLCFALLAVWFGWSNAGGEAAHIGGALAGFYFIRNPHHLHGMFDFLGRFDPTSRVSKARAAARRGAVGGAEIDRILGKIRENGLHSLSEDEKRALREASRR